MHSPPLQGSSRHSSSSSWHFIPYTYGGQVQLKLPTVFEQWPWLQKFFSLHSLISWSHSFPLHPLKFNQIRIHSYLTTKTFIQYIFDKKSQELTHFTVGVSINDTFLWITGTMIWAFWSIITIRTVSFVCEMNPETYVNTVCTTDIQFSDNLRMLYEWLV